MCCTNILQLQQERKSNVSLFHPNSPCCKCKRNISNIFISKSIKLISKSTTFIRNRSQAQVSTLLKNLLASTFPFSECNTQAKVQNSAIYNCTMRNVINFLQKYENFSTHHVKSLFGWTKLPRSGCSRLLMSCLDSQRAIYVLCQALQHKKIFQSHMAVTGSLVNIDS